MHQTHLKISLLLSGPRLIHWDCQALCLGPRLGFMDDDEVLVVDEEDNAEDGVPPLAISLMRSKGFRTSPLSFDPPPKLPKGPTCPRPDAPAMLPVPVKDGIDAVAEL